MSNISEEDTTSKNKKPDGIKKKIIHKDLEFKSKRTYIRRKILKGSSNKKKYFVIILKIK